MTGLKIMLSIMAFLCLSNNCLAQEAVVDQLNRDALRLYREGNLNEAIRIGEKSVEIAKKTFGPNSLWVSTSMNNLAQFYLAQHKYEMAEPLLRQSLAIDEKILGKNSRDIALTLDNLATICKRQARYSEAEPLQKRSLSILEKALGKNHPDVGTSLSNLALLFDEQGKYAEAEPLLKRALEIEEKALGGENPELATTLSNLAALYVQLGRYTEVEPLLKRSLSISERALGKDHAKNAIILNNLGQFYATQGKYADAEFVFKRSLIINEKHFGENSLENASTLSNLGALYEQQGRYSDAETLHKKSLSVKEKTLGKNHPDVAITLNNLALLQKIQGNYTKAESDFKRAISIAGMVFGKDHIKITAYLDNLASLYADQGNPVEAENLMRQSLVVKEKHLDREHPAIASSFHNLGTLCTEQGKYDEASMFLKKSLAIKQNILGKYHPDTANTLNSLSILLGKQGKYAEAEQINLETLALYEKTFGNQHKNIAMSMNNLGLIQAKQGKYIEAEKSYRTSLSVCEKSLGEKHPKTAVALCNLGILLQHQENYLGALDMFERSLAISNDQGLDPQWPQNCMANLFLDQGNFLLAEPIVQSSGYSWTRARHCLLRSDFSGAKEYYEQMRKDCEQNGEVDGLFVAYCGLGMAFEGLGDTTQSLDFYHRAVDLTEDLRFSLKQNSREGFFDTSVYCYKRTTPYKGSVRILLQMNRQLEALRGSEYSKARSFSEQISGRANTGDFKVPVDVLKLDETLQDQLSAMKKAREDAYKTKNQTRVNFLESEIARIEEKFQEHIKTLRREYPLFAASRYPQPMDLTQAELRPDEWVLEYDVTDTGLAIFLVKGKELLKAFFKPIPKKELESLVLKFRAPIEQTGEGITNERLEKFDFVSGYQLAQLLISDVLTDIPEGQRLIIVPDDCLGSLPFEILTLSEKGEIVSPDGKPRVLGANFLGDRNPLSYYQSITALTLARTVRSEAHSGTKFFALVDPIFGEDDERIQKIEKGKRKRLLDSLPRQLMNSIKTESGITFPRLQLTGELGNFVKKSNPGVTDLFEGFAANKKSLFGKNLLVYRAMLFATHGHFGNDLPGLLEPVLVLTLVDQPPGEDGFLRLTEIMGLKLNCDIAALTACKSGSGKHISGEGAMGIGRAFQYAGAKSVLMSLWNVAEKSSVKLVESFFKHLNAGKNKLEALTLARNEIRQQGYDHPFYWAPFILVGETE